MSIKDDFEEVQARIARKTSDGDMDKGEAEGELNGVSPTEDDRRQADVCFETLVNIAESDFVQIRQLNIKTLARILYDRYDLSSPYDAENLIRARAPLLLQLLDNVQPGGLNLTKRAIYRELQAVNEVPDKDEISHSPLRERSPPPPEQSDDQAPVVRKGHHRK